MIRFPLRKKPLKLKRALVGPGSGPSERIKLLKIMVTKLIRDERIEGQELYMNETRAYAEQLLNLAIQNGDRDMETMRLADKWLVEKDLVHKLFKVLAPRYYNYSKSYTSVYRLPAKVPYRKGFQAVLELKGNPYPPVIPQEYVKDNFIVNVLIRSAKQSREKKTALISEEGTSVDGPELLDDPSQTNTPDSKGALGHT